MADFPGSLPDLKTTHQADDTIEAATDNAHAAEINAIAAELGTNPAGDAETVGARIAAVESDISGKADASELTAHIEDTSAAHAASAISYSGGTGMSATDVEAAIDELAAEKANAADVATDSELSAHASDTTGVHGIADTSDLVLDDDSRLTDARDPTAHASSHATGQSDAIAPGDIGAATTAEVEAAASLAGGALGVVVYDGVNLDTARPTGYECVIWVGFPSEPDNWVDGDLGVGWEA